MAKVDVRNLWFIYGLGEIHVMISSVGKQQEG